MKMQLCVMFISLLCGCGNDFVGPIHETDKVDFKLLVLGTDNRPDTIFDEGTDIRIALQLNNQSAGSIEWTYDNSCDLFHSTKFLLVSKIDGDSLGIPYKLPVACMRPNLPAATFPPGNSFVVDLPWNTNPGNDPLPAGKYYATAKFTIGDVPRMWDLKTVFEIR